MKMMRKTALMSAVCLMLTALPLPAAAADDPVLTQVAAVKNDKFTVDAKKLGYTALNGECPERPEWYHMPKMDESDYEYYYGRTRYANDDEWWKAQWKEWIESGYYYGGETQYEGTAEPAHYGVSNAIDGYGIITDGQDDENFSGFYSLSLIDKNGNIQFKGAFDNYSENLRITGDVQYDNGIVSMREGLSWVGELDGAYYYDIRNGLHFRHSFGNHMYNGYAAVLDCLEEGKDEEVHSNAMSGYFPHDEVEVTDEWGTHTEGVAQKIKYELSLINSSNEKVLTISEPMLLTAAGSMGGDGYAVTGYNYNMDMGGYSDGLIWFTCDRQLGTTLNDLIKNTDADKDDEIPNDWGYAKLSNEYKSAEHQCGYADLQGNIVIPQNYDAAWPFVDGIAAVGVNVDKSDQWNPVYKYGYIDKTGKTVIDMQFDEAGSFIDDIARVKKGEKYGFIDKTGNYIAEPKYDYDYGYRGYGIIGTGEFSEGFAKVALKEGEDAEGLSKLKYGYIDKTGAEVIPLQYEDASNFKNGLAYVKKDGKWGFINTKGETVLPFEYTETYGSDGRCFVVGKEVDGETKFGAVDADGNTILPFIFEDMSNPVNGLVYAFCNRELYSLEIAEILDTGDLSGDDEIGVDDVQIALKAYTEKVAGKTSDLTPGQQNAADVTGDGKLDIEDVQLILIYYTENTVAGKHVAWDDLLKK